MCANGSSSGAKPLLDLEKGQQEPMRVKTLGDGALEPLHIGWPISQRQAAPVQPPTGAGDGGAYTRFRAIGKSNTPKSRQCKAQILYSDYGGRAILHIGQQANAV